jgi:hypothetical protein
MSTTQTITKTPTELAAINPILEKSGKIMRPDGSVVDLKPAIQNLRKPAPESNGAAVSLEDLKAQLMAMQAENEALKAAKHTQNLAGRRLTCKVSEKGGLSAYGLGRFPVTLYAEQWEFLIANIETVKSALKANATTLTRKAS